MMKQQINQEIRSITSQLIRKYKPEKIILFGSAVYGNFGPDSDLDLLVIKDGIDNIKKHERHYLIRKLLKTDFPVDVLVYTPYEIRKRLYLGDPFIKRIVNEGKTLYGA